MRHRRLEPSIIPPSDLRGRCVCTRRNLILTAARFPSCSNIGNRVLFFRISVGARFNPEKLLKRKPYLRSKYFIFSTNPSFSTEVRRARDDQAGIHPQVQTRGRV